MDLFEETKLALKENFELLSEKYKVRTVGVFGSYMRGEQKKGNEKNEAKVIRPCENEPIYLIFFDSLR